MNDFSDRFPDLGHVGIGQLLCPHITTEVDRESLSSTAGLMSHPRRAQREDSHNTYLRKTSQGKKLFLQRTYCHLPYVYRLYMERHNKGDWDETKNQDDERFLEVEKEIWKEMYPHCSIELDEESESDEEAEEEEEQEEENGEIDSQNSSGSEIVMQKVKVKARKHR